MLDGSWRKLGGGKEIFTEQKGLRGFGEYAWFLEHKKVREKRANGFPRLAFGGGVVCLLLIRLTDYIGTRYPHSKHGVLPLEMDSIA